MSKDPQLPRLIRLFDRLLSWVALICGGATLMFMTCFMTWDFLVMRKALNASIVGGGDILILTLVGIVAISIPLGARTGAHIEIEIVESKMSAWFAKWSLVFVKLLGFALLVIMAQQMWKAGEKTSKFGETTQQLLISYEPFYYLLSVSIGIYAFVLLLDIYQLLTRGNVTKLRIGDGVV